MTMSTEIRDLELAKFRESSLFPEKSVVAVTVEGSNDIPTTLTTVENVEAENSNQIYSFDLPANCKGFFIQARFPTKWKFGFDSNLEKFITMGFGSIFKDSNFYTTKTIYFSSEKPNNYFEIVAYN